MRIIDRKKDYYDYLRPDGHRYMNNHTVMEPKDPKSKFIHCRACGHQVMTFETREDAELFIRLYAGGLAELFPVRPRYCSDCQGWHVEIGTPGDEDGEGETGRGK